MRRLASFLGFALIGFAAYVVSADRKKIATEQQRREAQSVEELGDRLKAAWADRHTR